MDIKDLSKIDFNNIDWGKAGAYLSVHFDAVIRVSIIILTVWGLLRVLDGYVQQTKQFSVQITEMEEKLAQVAAYNKSAGGLQSFWKKAPKFLNDDLVVNYITDLATKNKVDILSFSPGQKSADKFAETNKFKFKLRAKEYKDLVFLVRSIENSGFALRLESVNCVIEAALNSPSILINVQMEMSSIKLNEQKDI